MASYDILIQQIIKRLLTGSIRLHYDPAHKLGFNFENTGAFTIPLERQRTDDLLSYLQQTKLFAIAADIFWSFSATGKSEDYQNTLMQPEHDTKAWVLLLNRHRLIPDAVTKIVPNLNIAPDSPVLDRMWPVIPLINYIPTKPDVKPAHENDWCQKHPDHLCVRRINSTGDWRYTGYNAKANKTVSFYLHKVDISRPWTIVSKPDCTETAMEIPLYEEVTPAVSFYQAVQKGEEI